MDLPINFQIWKIGFALCYQQQKTYVGRKEEILFQGRMMRESSLSVFAKDRLKAATKWANVISNVVLKYLVSTYLISDLNNGAWNVSYPGHACGSDNCLYLCHH